MESQFAIQSGYFYVGVRETPFFESALECFEVTQANKLVYQREDRKRQ